ncbi:hypothetical protein HNY73_018608 [Argiope bruennichi]|uniref:Uncharacterized protein n=1 Tax=Argiope bruennichi TaxID=94029 RepID=A0A8T0EDS1_ARGBR|nr:hypothetical protein HNY73_018608 [Argiope bruennichi]
MQISMQFINSRHWHNKSTPRYYLKFNLQIKLFPLYIAEEAKRLRFMRKKELKNKVFNMPSWNDDSVKIVIIG